MAWYNAIRLSERDPEVNAVETSICGSGHKAVKKREMENGIIVKKAIYNRPNQIFFRIIAWLEYFNWLFAIVLRFIAWVKSIRLVAQ